MDPAEKAREHRARAVAQRQGLVLVKSRRRAPRVIGYGLYVLLSARQRPDTAAKAFRKGRGLTLDTGGGRVAPERKRTCPAPNIALNLVAPGGASATGVFGRPRNQNVNFGFK